MLRILATFPILLLFAASGCGQFPRDAEKTLQEIEQERPLRIGWSAAAPWVRAVPGGEPAGIEPDIVRRWAASRGIKIEWVEASEAQIVEGLNGNSLDVAVSGFTDKAPHGGLIGQTQPYLKVKVVIGAAPGAAIPETWKGVVVSYDRTRPDFAALLRAQKAVPTTASAPYRLVYEPELASLGLAPTGETLRTDRRTIATAPSENALTLALDEFLHANKAPIEALVGREAPR